MRVTQRHPMMRSALSAEKGVFATYTVAVLATLGAILAAGLLLGSAPAHQSTAVSTIAAEIGSIWVDAGPQRAPGIEQSASFESAAPAKAGLDINAAGRTTDQPVYDEAGAIDIYLR